MGAGGSSVNLRWIKHLYTAPLGSTVYRQRERFKLDVWRQKEYPRFKATQSIYFRGPKEPDNWEADAACVDYAVLGTKEWLTAKNMISRIRRAIEEDAATNNIPVKIGATGRCYIERLDAESVIDWGAEDNAYGKKHILRMMLTLETNPGAAFYIAGQGGHFEVGSLQWINPLAIHSMMNVGTFPVVTMICDFAVEE